MKHHDIQLHSITEEVSSKLIKLCYTPTSDMLAYILTKSVGWSAFLKAMCYLGVLHVGKRKMLKITTMTSQNNILSSTQPYLQSTRSPSADQRESLQPQVEPSAKTLTSKR
ncbi:hypothetical protein O181_090572 [Austropuccinia psidii MF-1]|uniref:Uncharacterized protein n=1 Tax=Austropuccinia psidii MF-1 TaxID=1389203 RepID=A0A9Q3IVL8_9BASI|nr:hypothetical protein [Austropuccinia psidii MF-1]